MLNKKNEKNTFFPKTPMPSRCVACTVYFFILLSTLTFLKMYTLSCVCIYIYEKC